MKINSWQEIIDVIEKSIPNFPDITTNYIQFRGQSNADWKLEPSLLRLVKGNVISEKKVLFYEKQARMEFISQFHIADTKISYSDSINPISILVDMQHFSCPTRLLDWSESAFIALYFAVNENLDKDGALFMWDSRIYNSKMKELYKDFSKIGGDNIFEHNDYDIVNIIFSTRKNERLIKQRGSFSVSNNLLENHCDMICKINKENPNKTGLYKIEIPKELKREFLARLRYMNISADSLFPGLDGLGRSIKETLILRQWSEDKQHFA
jgi:hypothetical protein